MKNVKNRNQYIKEEAGFLSYYDQNGEIIPDEDLKVGQYVWDHHGKLLGKITSIIGGKALYKPIKEELKPWNDYDSSYNKGKMYPGQLPYGNKPKFKSTNKIDDRENRIKDTKDFHEKAKELCRRAYKAGERNISYIEGLEPEEMQGYDDGFEGWWEEQTWDLDNLTDNYHYKTNENVLPKPYKTTKCLECGETVCDDLNKKIGHLYNKHNCKPSVGDYKAKIMLKEYFK